MRQSVCVAVVACILLAGCGGKKRVALPQAARVGSTETGVASWYGHPYHGRRTASGEVYDMEQMTAAHRTLPFGTWVRVTRLDNHKTVEVRITDRGPFVGGRIVDLSRAAAASIDMIGPGISKVRLTVLGGAGWQPAKSVRAGDPPAPQPLPPSPVQAQTLPQTPAWFAVQVGSFTDRRNAERVRSTMERSYGSANIVMRDGQPPQWRVLVGHEATEESAEILAERMRADPAAQTSQAFVVKIDTEAGPDGL